MTRRRERINHLIRSELSELLRRQVKDPRLNGLVTVTEVTCSPDLRQAKVFISIMGSEEQKKQVLSGLKAASGFLRRELGTSLSLRYTPELNFEQDNSIEQGSHLVELIEQVVPNDRPEANPG